MRGSGGSRGSGLPAKGDAPDEGVFNNPEKGVSNPTEERGFDATGERTLETFILAPPPDFHEKTPSPSGQSCSMNQGSFRPASGKTIFPRRAHDTAVRASGEDGNCGEMRGRA